MVSFCPYFTVDFFPIHPLTPWVSFWPWRSSFLTYLQPWEAHQILTTVEFLQESRFPNHKSEGPSWVTWAPCCLLRGPMNQPRWLVVSVTFFLFQPTIFERKEKKKKRPLWTHPFLSQIILFNGFPIRPNPMRWNFCHACHPAQKGFENSQKLVRGENMWRDSTRSFPSMVGGPPLPRCVQIWAELWSHCSRKEKATVLP